MSTITAILEPDADGTLHLPIPLELRGGKVRVEAKMEAAPADASAGVGPEIIQQRLEAFAQLRKMNPFRDIADPVEWQREMREDVRQPGRD